MISEQYEVEGVGLDLYTRASLDPARDTGGILLARALGFEVVFTPRLDCRARLVVVPKPVIQLRAAIAPAGAEYDAAHEIPHWYFDKHACGDPRLERACDRVAVSIVAPAPAMFRMRAVFGYRIDLIAAALGTSETIVALRWGEVFYDEPVAVITPRGIRRSGPEMGADDATLRRIARAGGGEGVRVIRMRQGWMLIGATD